MSAHPALVPSEADAARISEMLQALAEFGRFSSTGVDRVAFTDEDEKAHQFIEQQMRDVGLETRFDAFGNLFGRRPGEDPSAPVVLTGSHLDGPPEGGMFDGTVGVVCALEAVRQLNQRGTRTRAPIEVVATRCEHLDRFGLSCLGSRAMAGKLTEDHLDQLTDAGGESLRDVLRSRGYLSEELSSVVVRGRVAAFLELHIEQGRVLESRGERLGVVTAIAGPTRHKMRFEGTPDHSGGTPMAIRRDALCGAAELTLELERLAAQTKSSVGTVGVLHVAPGAIHTIPGSAELYSDIRGVDSDEKERLVESFLASAEAIAAKRGLTLTYDCSVDEPPVPCSPELRSTMTASLREAGFDFIEMPSGGGHDTQHLAHVVPAGMMFVPSVAGISHSPEEFTEASDLALGAAALVTCLEAVAGASEPQREEH